MRFVNLHTHRFTGDPAILELVNQYPRGLDASIPYYSIGIHPWHIDQRQIDTDLQIVGQKIQSENCLALGECGLDKRIETDLALQVGVFEKQLALAQQYEKPVIIHCVAAFQELIEIKRRLKIAVPMVIHGFSKNLQTAKQLIDSGFYLSFGKYLLRNPELEKVFVSVPSDRFFLETDTVEESIANVYELAAKYRNQELEGLQLQIKSNFKTVFNLNEF